MDTHLLADDVIVEKGEQTKACKMKETIRLTEDNGVVL